MDILKEQPTQEKPYLVDNYPYGFRLRTQIRYWVETTNRGQRFASQTLNPKTGKWNTPKLSTYSQIVLIGLEKENGHVTYVEKSAQYSSLQEVEAFGKKYSQYFDEYQKKEFNGMVGLMEVFDKVEYTIKTRLFRHKKTGLLTEAVPIMELNDYEEVNDFGSVDAVDSEREEQEKINRDINIMATLNAKEKQGGSLKDAINTLKRA